MERRNRILERRFFISVIVLMTVSYYFMLDKLQGEKWEATATLLNVRAELKETHNQLMKCDDWVNFLEEEPNDIVIATVYNNTVEQTNEDNYHTASMFDIDSINQYQHRIMAVSRDLIKRYPFGSRLHINGTGKYDGVWIVQDVMNERYSRRIDLLINEGMDIGEWAVTLKEIK